MRFLHTADSHIGYAAYNALTPEGLNRREDDVQRAFSWSVDTAIGEGVDAFVHAGDLFDSIRPSNRAVRFAMDELRRLSTAGIPFIVISGNHDTPRMRSTGSVLRLLEHIDGVHAFYGARPGVVRLGDTAFTCLGHVPDAALFASSLGECVPVADAERNVLVLHLGVSGVSVFRTAEFNELVVPQGSLPRGFDYTALGHYHGHVDVCPGAAYSGSLERFSLNEADDGKGAVIVDLDDGGGRFVGYAPRRMARLSIDASGLDAAGVASRCAGLADSVEEGAIVSLSLSGLDPAARRSLDVKAVRERFGHALNFALRMASAEGMPDPGGGLGERGLSDELFAYAKSMGANERAIGAARRFLEASE